MLIIFFLSFVWSHEDYLQIVSYNLQNLFDSKHDQGKLDHEFLPFSHPLKKAGCQKVIPSRRKNCRKLDWNEGKVENKISQIKKAIGTPDILAVVEVENESVIKKLGYSNYVLSKHTDARGLRNALLFRKGKLMRQKELIIENSRSILEVRLSLENFNSITFFINHWPSQNHKGNGRKNAANILNKRISRINGEKIIILGDFNLDPKWEYSSLFENKNLIDLSEDWKTYFFIPDKKWFGYDRILISKNLNKFIKSSRVINGKEISTVFISNGKEVLIPKRYNFFISNVKYHGFSDHYPVELVLVNRNEINSSNSFKR